MKFSSVQRRGFKIVTRKVVFKLNLAHKIFGLRFLAHGPGEPLYTYLQTNSVNTSIPLYIVFVIV